MVIKDISPPPVETSAVRQALPQILAVCVKNVLLTSYGLTLGFPTILIPSLSGDDPDEKITMGVEEISWIGSLNLICVPLGCLFSGPVTHNLGRKLTMQLVTIPFIAAFLIFHFSNRSWHIFLALCLTGFTGGLLEAPVLTYVAEITQPHLRGILSSTSSASVSLGILGEFLLGTFLSWRTVSLVNCVVPIMSFILLMFVPETPIFLLSNNKYEEAKKSIAWLRGWTKPANIEPEFQELYKQLKQKESEKKESRIQLLHNLAKKTFLWPYFVVSLAFALGSFSGNQPLQTYAIKIFSTVKAPIDRYYATVIIGVIQLIGCILSVIIIHVLGKRILNFISLIGCGTCFMVAATYIYSIDIKYIDDFSPKNVTTLTTTGGTGTQWVPVVFLIFSSFFSYLGIRILPWVLTGEVYPNEVRATASGLSGGIGYLFNFMANKTFPTLVSHITLPGVFWLYGSVGLIGTVLLYFFLPETEGKSLFEITEHFAGNRRLSNKVHRRKHNAQNGHSNAAFEPDENNPVESKL
ncbi:unnamed protein product [Callosobruchus maculatus]|uniref:Major facilitator superfamily (MFS) profile domain-containing protein n=1 Tax=Callosobruchus maculatus TaxID=64391 RepID=A0A653CF58_CALMS|nr:unnamed protein product [Callosobruchus maculatus]